MEDLMSLRKRLNYGKYMNRRLHAWPFARLQSRIEDKVTDVGIPVEYINPAYTSQTCHECRHIGKGGRKRSSAVRTTTVAFRRFRRISVTPQALRNGLNP
ncbi:IS200/IS605 family accessory protein TnpB-related protein [Haladaptatus caseinilyticus]|uniref:IS200/IS605 family accessory protein TnpB-related protein n=1 Tax=Haladaptatus caseinilyticus TaxID=2993314 RepID=UPI002E1D4085